MCAWGYWKGVTQARSIRGHRQTGSQRGANVWRLGASGNFHDRRLTENGSERGLGARRGSAEGAAFRRRHPSHSTIGFGEFERRPEMGLDVAVAELGAPATVGGGEGGGAEVDAEGARLDRLVLGVLAWRSRLELSPSFLVQYSFEATAPLQL
jgi:hypothetical protein